MKKIAPLSPEECVAANKIIAGMSQADTDHSFAIFKKGGDEATVYFRDLINDKAHA